MGSPPPDTTSAHVAAPLRAWRPASQPAWLRWVDVPAVEVLLVATVFLVHAAWPVPEVNESHYLTKAKHYWNPQWCANDFFCNTADAHQVFYWSVGWLSRWLSLPALAWTGRLIGWLLLAWSWRRLSRAVVDVPLAAVLTASLFVTACGRWHLAGEWVVGGIEAKVFAYAAVFLAWEAALGDRWGRALVLVGLASAFHVLVGGWASVTLAAAFVVAHGRRPRVVKLMPAAIAGIALALVGLVPALALTWHVDPAIAAEASRIYVFERLPHHLVITGLPSTYILRFGALTAVCGVLAWFALRSAEGETRESVRRLAAGIAASLAIALVGVAITLALRDRPLEAAGLLRYYWYRLSDVMLPVGFAIFSVTLGLELARNRRAAAGYWLLTAATLLAGWHLADTVWYRQRLARAGNFGPQADAKLPDLADWQTLCTWLGEHAPGDAVFLTPYGSQSFRWYAERAEVVNRKDIPQDAPSIVKWWQRLQDVHRAGTHRAPSPWHASLSELGAEGLVRVAGRFGAQFVVTASEPRLPLPTLGPTNLAYIVYRVPPEAP